MKTNMNKVELIGFAGMNPELVELPNKVKVARLRLATSENYRDKNGAWKSNTAWHNIVMWNDMAKKAAQEIKKGSHVSLTGKLSYRNYETKSGEKRYTTEIIALDFQVVPKEF